MARSPVVPFAHGRDVAYGIIERREDESLSNLVDMLGLIQGGLSQLTADSRLFDLAVIADDS